MSFLKNNLIIGAFILIAFISIGVFGLFQLNHMSKAPMIDCPYAQNGSSLCENTFNHINDWRQFSNTIFPSLFIFLILTLGIVLYYFSKQNFLNQNQYFYKWKYYLDNKKLLASPNRIIKWLSLLENSPAFWY